MAKSSSKPIKNISPPASTPLWERPWYPQILLAIVAFVLYANTLGHDFALDDAIVITDNDFTKSGFSGIDDLFTYDTFRGFFKVEGKENLVAGGRYRPFSLVVFAVVYEIFGESPFVFHLINVLFYALLLMLAYRFFVDVLLRNQAIRKESYTVAWAALAAALFFGVHPLHTEVVANVKGLDEILALLFGLFAMWSVLRWQATQQASWLGLSFITFFFGLLSKENTIMLVPIVPLVLWVTTPFKVGNYIKATAPILLASALFLFIRQQVVGNNIADESMELMNNPFLKWNGSSYIALTGQERWATIAVSLWKYLQLMVWPSPLTHDYYPRHIAIATMSNPLAIAGTLAYAGMAVVAVWLTFKKNIVGWGIAFFLITLFIASNIPFSIGANMSERFVFMPSLGIALAIGYGLAKAFPMTSKKPVWLGFGAIIATFSLLTILRNPVWKDNFTLFTTDVQTSANSAKLQNAAGGAKIEAAVKPGNETQKAALLTEAIAHLKKALEIHPTYKNPYLLLGNAYNYSLQYDASIQAYQQALVIDPEFVDARNNLLLTYRAAAETAGRGGDLAKAIQYSENALQFDSNDVESIRLLGVSYGNAGNHSKALEYFEKYAQKMPDVAAAWVNLTFAYANSGQTEKAENAKQKALSIDPNAFNPQQ